MGVGVHYYRTASWMRTKKFVLFCCPPYANMCEEVPAREREWVREGPKIYATDAGDGWWRLSTLKWRPPFLARYVYGNAVLCQRTGLYSLHFVVVFSICIQNVSHFRSPFGLSTFLSMTETRPNLLIFLCSHIVDLFVCVCRRHHYSFVFQHSLRPASFFSAALFPLTLACLHCINPKMSWMSARTLPLSSSFFTLLSSEKKLDEMHLTLIWQKHILHDLSGKLFILTLEIGWRKKWGRERERELTFKSYSKQILFFSVKICVFLLCWCFNSGSLLVLPLSFSFFLILHLFFSLAHFASLTLC